MKLKYWIIPIFLMIGIGIITYQMGKNSRKDEIINIATNEIIIKEIAELAALEVQGNASIKQTNISKDNSWMNVFKKAFIENTIQINIPYTAKYGIKTDTNQINIEQTTEDRLIIKVKAPELLSYELKLDKAEIQSNEGWLQQQDYQKLKQVQATLYKETKDEIAQSKKNKELAKQKIIQLLKNYYAPLNYDVEVIFDDENKPTIIQSILK